MPSKWSCKMGQCVSAFRASLLERAAETSAGWWPIPPCLRTPSQQRHLPAARSHMRSSTISRCCLTSPPAQVRRIPVLPPRHPACLGLPARGQAAADPVRAFCSFFLFGLSIKYASGLCSRVAPLPVSRDRAVGCCCGPLLTICLVCSRFGAHTHCGVLPLTCWPAPALLPAVCRYVNDGLAAVAKAVKA